MPAIFQKKASLVCLVKSSVSIGMVVSALGVGAGHTAGSLVEVALAPVSLQSSTTTLGLMRPFLSPFSLEATALSSNASSVGLQTFTVVNTSFFEFRILSSNRNNFSVEILAL